MVRSQPHRLSLLLALLLAAVFSAAVLIGPTGLPTAAAWKGLLTGSSEPGTVILREVRLPRALLGAMIGGILALSGSVLQGITRNPLVEPGVLGISAWASVGAVLALYHGVISISPVLLPLAAMTGAGLVLVPLGFLAAGRSGLLGLVLAGLAFSSLGGALVALILNLAPNPYAVSEMMLWLMGSVRDRTLADCLLALPGLLLGGGLLFALRRGLDALTLGDEVAASMGVSLGRVRLMAVAGVGLGVGSAVAVAGSIGFVGLIVPHLLRLLGVVRPSALLLPSALAGALLISAADLGVRLMAGTGGELQLGTVTSLIGAPVFLALLWRLRGRPQ